MKLALPFINIGGLSISDHHIRFVRIARNRTMTVSVILPPGAVVRGEPNDSARIAAALRNLRQQLASSPNNDDYVVVVLPVPLFSTTSFVTPAHAKDKGILLASHMYMPLRQSNLYAGSKCIVSPQPYQVVCAGAWAKKDAIDTWLHLFARAGFRAVAVEYPAAALVRAISSTKYSHEALVVHAGDDGLHVIAAHNGLPLVDHYASWRELYEEDGGKQLLHRTWTSFLVRTVQKTLNEYRHLLGRPLQQVMIMQPSIEHMVWQVLRRHVRLHLISFDETLSWTEFSEAYGAALRGQFPRTKDHAISIGPKGLERSYYRASTLRYIRWWRTIALAALGGVFLLSVGANLWLWQMSGMLKRRLAETAPAVVEEATKLQAQAQEFNRMLDIAFVVKADRVALAPALERINALARSASITFKRIHVDAERRVVLEASAKSEKAALQFKNLLSKESNFQAVVLPLANIKTGEDGTISFSLTLGLLR